MARGTAATLLPAQAGLTARQAADFRNVAPRSCVATASGRLERNRLGPGKEKDPDPDASLAPISGGLPTPSAVRSARTALASRHRARDPQST